MNLMREAPADTSAHWTAFWSALGTISVMFLIQFFRYLTKRNTTDAVEGRAVLDNGWKTLFDSQNQAHGTAIASVTAQIERLEKEHQDCLDGQRALREKQDALAAQIELLRTASIRHEVVLVITDHRGIVITASEASVLMFKRPLSEIIGNDCRQLMDDSAWSRHSEAFTEGRRAHPPGVTSGNAKDATGATFAVTVDTRRSFVGSDGKWVFVAEIVRAKV